jgi:trans-aconitate methyltransferase
MTRLLPILLATACSVAPAAEPGAAAQRRPEVVLAALAIPQGAHIADVGAGRGYFTSRLLAAAGPEGRVVATDVDAEALAAIPRDPRIETRVVTPDDPGLESGAYDLLFLAQVDQYLPDRAAYFRALRPALRQGGRLAVVNKLSYRRAVAHAAEAAGYRVIGGTDALPGQFLLVYEVAP